MYLVWYYAIEWLSVQFLDQDGSVPFLYKMILIEMAAAVSINVILNYYWSYLILRQVYRLLAGKNETDFHGNDKGDDKDVALEMSVD